MRVPHPASMTAQEISNHRNWFTGFGTAKNVTLQDYGVGVVYIRDDLVVTAFKGKAVKPAVHLAFRTVERRDAYIATWVTALKASADARGARAQARTADTHGLLKGSILYSTWGYEQTNVDWYEVVEVVTAKTVIVRKIGGALVDGASDGPMSGRSVPMPGNYIGEPMRKRATSSGFNVTSYSHASPWDGKSVYCSWYA